MNLQSHRIRAVPNRIRASLREDAGSGRESKKGGLRSRRNRSPTSCSTGFNGVGLPRLWGPRPATRSRRIPLRGRHLHQTATMTVQWITSFSGRHRIGGAHPSRSPGRPDPEGPPHRAWRSGAFMEMFGDVAWSVKSRVNPSFHRGRFVQHHLWKAKYRVIFEHVIGSALTTSSQGAPPSRSAQRIGRLALRPTRHSPLAASRHFLSKTVVVCFCNVYRAFPTSWDPWILGLPARRHDAPGLRNGCSLRRFARATGRGSE